MTEPAEIKQKRLFSPIWLIPIITLIAATWMLYQYQMSKGTEIFIVMPHAEGIVAGKTELKVKSVKMGVISHIRLSDDQKHAIARAEVKQEYAQLLRQDAKIWIVKPRVDETGISGLTTLLSGVYLEFSPGSSEQFTDTFTLLANPPLISDEIQGARYQLLSKDADVLDVGTGIFYKGYRVGQIETAEFDWKNQIMRYGIFVRAPYQNLVAENIVFWLNSAVELDLNADGINIKAGSLSKVLKGGISFAVPEGEMFQALAKAQHQFKLSKDYKTALEERYEKFDYYVIQFEQSIRGLNIGAPVEYRGIRIGTVVEAPAMLVVGDRPAYFSTESTAVPVKVKIEYRRIFHDADIAKEFWQGNVDSWIEKGLRASLKTGNLLTGSAYVDFDLYPDVLQFTHQEIAGLKVFPSTSSGFSVIANQVSDVLAKISRLDVETPLQKLNQAIDEYKSLAQNVNQIAATVSHQNTPEELTLALKQINKSMATFDVTMAQFEKTMDDYENGSAMYYQLEQTLLQLKKITEQLQPLTKELNEQPNMLIFDRDLNGDILPKKGTTK